MVQKEKQESPKQTIYKKDIKETKEFKEYESTTPKKKENIEEKYVSVTEIEPTPKKKSNKKSIR